MLGIKIKEFDNSDGKIDTFNIIFKNTPISVSDKVEYVEIGGIVKKNKNCISSPFVRNLILLDKNYKTIGQTEHDFGKTSYYGNFVFASENNIRFKYIARDLEGELLAVAYNMDELADKMNCKVNFIKKIVNRKIKKHKSKIKKQMFNVRRTKI